MPHLTLDYSGNLAADGDLQGLCERLAATLIAQREDGKPVFPPGGVRVRAFAASHWCVADGRDRDAGYLHASLKIGSGRSDAAKAATCEALFAVIKAHFAGRFDRHGLALSLEFGEFSEAGTLKHNNLHARLKARG